jgi:mechanosensitive ion channel protein 1/2/3
VAYVVGVATAFAARDVLGNMLSGFSLQFSKPFIAGDYIKVPYGHLFSFTIR